MYKYIKKVIVHQRKQKIVKFSLKLPQYCTFSGYLNNPSNKTQSQFPSPSPPYLSLSIHLYLTIFHSLPPSSSIFLYLPLSLFPSLPLHRSIYLHVTNIALPYAADFIYIKELFRLTRTRTFRRFNFPNSPKRFNRFLLLLRLSAGFRWSLDFAASVISHGDATDR